MKVTMKTEESYYAPLIRLIDIESIKPNEFVTSITSRYNIFLYIVTYRIPCFIASSSFTVSVDISRMEEREFVATVKHIEIIDYDIINYIQKYLEEHLLEDYVNFSL